MNSTKMMVGAVVFATVLLAGCSKSDMANKVLDTQLTQVLSDVQTAKAEAARANQRLDNLTRGYKK